MSLRLGDRARCQRCGGKIILVDDARVISLDQAVWIHVGTIRRTLGTHAAEGPTE